MDSYFTLQSNIEASGEFVDRKSRFIAQLVHIEFEDEANAFIEMVRKRHYDARHNVPAWILVDGRERQSDDGEPSRTSGMPTLEVLRGAGLKNVCCVVTRYFGGVLLGAGGLVRAYTQGAVVALKAAQVVEMLPSCQYLCEVAYPLWDKVQYALKSLPVQLLSSEFTTAVGFTLLIRQTDAQSVLDTLTRVTDGRIETLLEEESYRAWDSESK